MQTIARAPRLSAPSTAPRAASSRRAVSVQCSATPANGKINTLGIRKEEAKVVDFCKTTDVPAGGKVVYCRCWRSATFPKCDGAHVKHNEVTGDNTGPLVIENPASKQ